MNVTTLIIENLRAMGANPQQVTRPDGSTEIKVNAPKITEKRTCETCARFSTCNKQIGIIYGFCNSNYIPAEDRNQ